MATEPNDYALDLVRLSELRADPANPKGHDVDLVAGSLARFGYIDPIVRDERTGYLISGHGRTDALRAARDAGADPPRGVHPTPAGDDWLVPVVVGWRSSDDTEARAALITLNRSTEAGGWVDDALLSLLEDLRAADALHSVGFTEDDIESLRARLMEVDGAGIAAAMREAAKDPPTPRGRTLDVSLTFGRTFEALLCFKYGWYHGGIASRVASYAARFAQDWPHGPRLAFMDNEWTDYEHEAHLAGLARVHPRYATVRDLVTREQAANAGVAYYSLSETLDMAAQVAEHTDSVVLIPKYDCLDSLPETIGGTRVVLGYSVPSSYGGTLLPPAAFAGRPTHLLGGAWLSQRGFLNEMGADVVSLDNNHVAKIARVGQVQLPDGSLSMLGDLLPTRPTSRHFYLTLALSLWNISHCLETDYDVDMAVRHVGAHMLEQREPDDAESLLVETRDMGDEMAHEEATA